MPRVTPSAVFFSSVFLCACAASGPPAGDHAAAPVAPVAQVAPVVPVALSNPPQGPAPALDEGRGIGAPPDELHAWGVHDNTRPQPDVVEPPTPSVQSRPGLPPSDAVVLFDSQAQHPSLDAFVGAEGIDAPWVVEGGSFRVAPESKSIRTRASFGDIQLHVEWKIDPGEAGDWGQARGNSGLYLMGRYEVQISDNLGNPTYPDGMAGSVYGQNPPLVNPGLGLDRWQTYDIIFRAPRWADDGALEAPADVTVLHNGVLVQDHWILEGSTMHKKRTGWGKPHGPAPIVFQDHKDVVHYRNIWVRELPPRPVSRQVQQMLDQ